MINKTPMKVLHIESGLGNQMLDYCDLIAVRKMNPESSIFIETIIYSISEAHQIISQWNGYELERIFNISERNISELFSKEIWNEILDDIRKSDFWNDNWRFPSVFVRILNNHGLNLHNRFYNYRESLPNKYFFRQTDIAQSIKRVLCRIIEPQIPLSRSFERTDVDTFEWHTLSYMYRGSGIERIEREIRSAFVFPNDLDTFNSDTIRKIRNQNSISVHIRRGDGMEANHRYYERGYYKKAVNYIKHKVDDPVFYLFSEPGSLEWVRNHLTELGLINEQTVFVDWNKGLDSYKDMQLMMECKHNIISYSSFSWWASYLNLNKNKITLSPEPRILTTEWI